MVLSSEAGMPSSNGLLMLIRLSSSSAVGISPYNVQDKHTESKYKDKHGVFSQTLDKEPVCAYLYNTPVLYVIALSDGY